MKYVILHYNDFSFDQYQTIEEVEHALNNNKDTMQNIEDDNIAVGSIKFLKIELETKPIWKVIEG